MSGLEALFKEAVAEYKAGQKEQARDLLMEIVDLDEQHEQAWLYLSAVVGTLEEQQICLENVLAINPDSARAKKGLEKVHEQIIARDATTAASDTSSVTPSEQTTSPFSTFDWDSALSQSADRGTRGHSAPIGAEYEAASGDHVMGDAELGEFRSLDSTAALEGTLSSFSDDADAWLANRADDTGTGMPDQVGDPFASMPSVDWNRSSGAAGIGSGQPVGLPSEQEYDSWVQNLNLGGDDPDRVASASPKMPVPGTPDAFGDDDARPFGDSGYMLGSDAFSGAASFDELEAYDADDTAGEFDAPGTPYDDFVSAIDAESEPGSADDLQDSGTSFGSSAIFGEEPEMVAADAAEDDLSDLVFSFDDDGSGTAPAESKDVARPKADERARYFAMIPEEIEVTVAPARHGLLLAAILVMIGLNVASFALLLM